MFSFKFTNWMTNSVDPDQMACSEAIWSGSTLFAKVEVVANSRIRVNDWCIPWVTSSLFADKHRGGSRIISVGGGVGFIKSSNLLYVFGQTGRENSIDLDQTPQNAASDQGLHCLPLAKQFYTHSQVVKWTCWTELQNKEKGVWIFRVITMS